MTEQSHDRARSRQWTHLTKSDHTFAPTVGRLTTASGASRDGAARSWSQDDHERHSRQDRARPRVHSGARALRRSHAESASASRLSESADLRGRLTDRDAAQAYGSCVLVPGAMLALAITIALSPHLSAWAVSDSQDEHRALLRIGWAESRLRPIGVHKRDVKPRGWTGAGRSAARRVGDAAWEGAVRAQALNPADCSWHERGDASDWSTRGSWGMVAAYAVPYLPGCWPPWSLDVPLVSAWVAVRRLRVARGRRSTPGLRRWARE